MTEGDLLPTAIRTRDRALALRRRTRHAGIAYLAVLTAASVVGFGYLRAKHGDADGNLSHLDTRVAEAQEARDELAAEASRLEKDLDSLTRSAVSPDWSILVRTIASLADGRLQITRLELTPDSDEGRFPRSVAIEGNATTAEDAADIVTDISALPVFRSAALREAQRRPEGGVQILLTAEIGSPSKSAYARAGASPP